MNLMNAPDAWLIRPKPRPEASTILFCVPYAGSGAAAYRGWAEHLTELDVCYVQLPGRENRLREKPFASIPSLVEALGGALEGWLNRPYAFYGHSLGGIVAYELARVLRKSGKREPLHLFVSASRAPHLPKEHPAVSHLPDVQLLEEIHRRYDSVPPQLMNDPELRELLVPGLRADLSLLETYRYTEGAPLGCGITCFGATRDSMVSRDALEQWRSHTKEEFSLQMFDGGHLFLQTARNELLAAVCKTLRRNSPPPATVMERGYGEQDVTPAQ
jgi:medium-chain acyl-[acyl-carrier-protein] hydrolase